MNLNDLFTVASLTAAINKLPAEVGMVGQMGLFADRGITTTTAVIEENAGRLFLVANTSRNDDPAQTKKDKRKRIVFEAAHLPTAGTLLPDELQNVAAFGSDSVTDSQAQVINDRLQGLKNSVEATREYHRVGALRGIVLDADGSTVLRNLYTEFGVTKKSINIPFTVAGTDTRKLVLDGKRHAEKKLAGVVVRGYRALCGSDFFDALTSHPTVKAAYEGWQAAQDRLGGDLRKGFTWGGVEYIEYNAEVSGKAFIPADVAQMFPVANGVFSTLNAPANYNETVNTLGKPFYAKAEERRMGKGWDLEVQANPLTLCHYPEALVEYKAT